jgi:hypothetical protein
MIRNVRFVPKGVGKVDVHSICNPKQYNFEGKIQKFQNKFVIKTRVTHK